MQHKTRPLLAAALGALTLWASGAVSAAVVLSTDFNGRTVSGATASNITWTTNGVVDPGSLTAVAGPLINLTPPGMMLFNTTAAVNRFAVNRNIQNESPWYVDIPVAVLAGNDIQLGTITLDAFIFNNDGLLQTVSRDLDLSLALLDDTLAQIGLASVSDIWGNSDDANSALPQPRPVSFNLSGNTLAAGESYFLRLTASGQGPGNNAGIDNFVVNGELTRAVPEPGSLALLGLALAGLGMSRLRKAN